MNYINGNLLDIPEGILVHQVNTLGVMGAGIALQIKKKWPQVYSEYKDKCLEGIELGDVILCEIYPKLVIGNLAGQEKLGPGSTVYDSYYKGLPIIKRFSELKELPIYFPYKIGVRLSRRRLEYC